MATQKQFIVNEDGEKTAVILPIEEYHELLEVVKERLHAHWNGKGEHRPNRYTAIIRQDGDWWIGWIEEVPAVICQEATRENLLESLRVTLDEMLELYREEALVDAGKDYVKEPIVV